MGFKTSECPLLLLDLKFNGLKFSALCRRNSVWCSIWWDSYSWSFCVFPQIYKHKSGMSELGKSGRKIEPHLGLQRPQTKNNTWSFQSPEETGPEQRAATLLSPGLLRKPFFKVPKPTCSACGEFREWTSGNNPWIWIINQDLGFPVNECNLHVYTFL